MKHKVVVVDDHKIFRNGLKMVLETIDDVEVVAEASNGIDFLEILDQQKVDLVFMDVNMPQLCGVETTSSALNKNENLKVIALTSYDTFDTIDKMLNAGADGYLLKDADYNEIIEAIDAVMSGSNFFSPKILKELTQRVSKQRITSKKNNYDELSKREHEILKLLCEGLSKKEIAKKLNISERTVEKHRENLMSKTNTNSTIALVVNAFKTGYAEI